VVRYLIAFGSCFLLWLLLTGTLAADEVLTGLAVSALIPLLAGERLRIFDGLRLRPGTPWYLLRYLGYFIAALVRANLDVARRVLTPQLPLHPAVVEVETALQSDLGRLLLANSITLTPGTLSVDIREQRLLVHWIDSRMGEDLEAATSAIAAGFEQRLQEFVR
jgi:multicomponent Na+:H+ antiporter subunit E